MTQETAGVAAWAALLRVHAAVLPKLERALVGVGLPIAWYDVLLVLNAAPERRLRMTELGQQAVVSRERVSRVVTELETAGLVERHQNPDDKRSFFATITVQGRRLLRSAAPKYLQAIEDHYTRHLTQSEIAMIVTGLGRVLVEEEAHLEPPQPRGGK